MFTQTLDPIGGSLPLSALLATIPLALLFVLLGVFRVKAWQAALAGLAASLLLAVIGWGMPVGQAASATLEGAFYGAIPILWILVNALWIYRLSVVTGWFDVLGERIRAISDDQRILAILIAFCFGALLESLAGFGAPVAISAAMLMAAGMKPLKAATVSLLANTAPVAFGSMGTPVITLAAVTGIDLPTLAAMTGRQTPFVAFVVPLVLVFMVDGRRGVRQTWPVALVAGVTFGLAQFLTANFLAVEITDIVAAIATVVVVLAMVRIWRPANPLETPVDGGGGTAVVTRTRTSTWMAVAPYAIIIAVFSVSQLPGVKAWLGEVGSVSFAWPGLDIVNASGKPVAATTFKLDHLKATGTLLLLSGLITMVVYKINIGRAVAAYRDTFVQLKWTIVTVLSVLALAFVMNLSGQTASLGTALASAGAGFVVLSPVLGWLGVAITGSDTSSNSLFGVLQVTAANQAGLSPVLMAATNSSAGVMGKMLSPQNLAVAAAAVGMAGREGDIFRKLVWWSLGLLAVFTVVVVLQATVLSWMVP